MLNKNNRSKKFIIVSFISLFLHLGYSQTNKIKVDGIKGQAEIEICDDCSFKELLNNAISKGKYYYLSSRNNNFLIDFLDTFKGKKSNGYYSKEEEQQIQAYLDNYSNYVYLAIVKKKKLDKFFNYLKENGYYGLDNSVTYANDAPYDAEYVLFYIKNEQKKGDGYFINNESPTHNEFINLIERKNKNDTLSLQSKNNSIKDFVERFQQSKTASFNCSNCTYAKDIQKAISSGIVHFDERQVRYLTQKKDPTFELYGFNDNDNVYKTYIYQVDKNLFEKEIENNGYTFLGCSEINYGGDCYFCTKNEGVKFASKKEDYLNKKKQAEFNARNYFTGQYEGEFKNLNSNPILVDLVNKFINAYKATGSKLYYTNKYKGEMLNGFPNGKGVYKLLYGERWDVVYYIYDGNWKNGLFDGEGALSQRFGTTINFIYKGNWKNNVYHGAGTFFKIINDENLDFMAFSGTFNEGVKEGKFTVTGQYKDKISNGIKISGLQMYEKFQFQYEVEYKNDIEIKRKLIFDQANKMNDYYADIVMKRNESARLYEEEKCSNCEMDESKSTYPKEVDNFLWPGTSHREGAIVMKNGDKYTFDYEKGKCKISNGVFETADYFTNFKAMIENLEKKCKEKYCK